MDQLDLSLEMAVDMLIIAYKDLKKYLLTGKPVLIKGLANLQPASKNGQLIGLKTMETYKLEFLIIISKNMSILLL